jgi:DNA-binding CsgD family transcriptional regulator
LFVGFSEPGPKTIMTARNGIMPWRKMWDYVSACGKAANLADMVRFAVREFPRLVSCEHPMACMVELDPIRGSVHVGVEHTGLRETVVNAYCQHYYKDDIARLGVDSSSLIIQMDWRQAKLLSSAFVREFIHELLQVDFTAGIPILNTDGTGAINFMFTRIGTGTLSSRDEAIMLALRPHLVNIYSLFKRLESVPADHLFAAELARESELLSKREAEVAGLLCKRLHAHEIATLLMISKRTVETHVQHVYEKLGVNNRRELLQKLLCQQ